MSAAVARARTLARVVALAPPSWNRFAVGILLTALTLLAGVGLLTVSGALISKAALEPPILALGTLIVGVRFFGFSRACLRYAERLAMHDVAFRALATLRERFFARLAPLVPGDAGMRQGELLARFVDDVDALQHLYLRAGGPPLAALVASLAAVAVAWIMLPAAAVVLAVGLALAGVLLPAATAWIGRVAARRQAAARAALTTEVLEVVQGAPELVAAGRAGERAGRLRDADADLRRLAVRDAVASSVAVGAGSFLQGATAVAVAVVAIPAVGAGELDGILLAALTFLALASFEAVQPLPASAQHLDACAASAERLLDVTDVEPAVRNPETPRPAGPGAVLEVEDVDLAFADGEPVLRGARLRLERGRTVALLGPSGAGKTTLASLLVRFRDPDGGRVTLDGADLRELKLGEIRTRVCLVAQDARLFTTTIAENVRLARPEATDAEVRTALEQAGLGPWIDELPDGLRTMVGEDGAQVSGGQRQRIALARGLLSDASLLVLDEPTTHVDPEGAEALLRELPRVAEGRGVLAIVHDRAGLETFDEVLELREGRIIPAR